MKPTRKSRVVLTLGLLLLSMKIMALEADTLKGSISPAEASHACHRLMTEEECSSYLLALATLPAGQEKDRLQAEHEDLMRERELACSCRNQDIDPTVLFPKVIQVQQAS